MNEEKKELIIVTSEIRKKLLDRGWNDRTIANALKGKTKTMKCLEIREYALSLGAKYWV